MARLMWWYLLWVMRRPWIKRLQKSWIRIVPVKRRDLARRNLQSQNRWALKHGLSLLVIAMNFLLASVMVTLFYLIAINLYEAGSFEVPKKADAVAQGY